MKKRLDASNPYVSMTASLLLVALAMGCGERAGEAPGSWTPRPMNYEYPTGAVGPYETPSPGSISYPSPPPTPAPTGMPTATPSPHANWGAKIDETFRDELHGGRLVFTAPSTMRQGRWDLVIARIGSSELGEAIRNGLAGLDPKMPSEDRATIDAPTKVATIMQLELTSKPGEFDILHTNGSPNSATEQVLGTDSPATWEWNVRPLKSGRHVLQIKAVAILRYAEADRRKEVPTLEREVLVDVDYGFIAQSFVGKNWKWLAGSVVIPIVGVVWRLLKPRKKKEK